ncbi:MAG TPA: hybrid sensor histidine kinase/response regulator [Polyangiaceae bacterium]
MSSAEPYELFLTLAPPRLQAARVALSQAEPRKRRAALEAALIPFVVDAALLGAEGLSELARAILESERAAVAELLFAIDELGRATQSLGSGDSSGARVDESLLRRLGRELVRGDSPEEPGAAFIPQTAPAAGEAEESHWVPQLDADMVQAFLDECFERVEGLSQRLLLLEERGDDPELVAEIFRDLHTLKGSSAFAGLTKMNQVAHRAEDLIGELRDGKRSCDTALVSVLLEALDALRAILERARAGQNIDLDVGELLLRLADPNAARRSLPPALPTTPETRAEGGKASDALGISSAQSTLRIDFEKVDLLLNLVGEVVLARGRLTSIAEVQSTLLREFVQVRKRLVALDAASAASRPSPLADDVQRVERVLRETSADLDGAVGALQLSIGQLRDTVMKLRMVRIAQLFTKHRRSVRELGQRLGKPVRVEISGSETELDKVLVERLDDPLLHLVRNAVDHGVEAPDVRRAAGKPEVATITLHAQQRGGQILVTIADDGRGLDPEKLCQKAIEKGVLSPEQAGDLSPEEVHALIFQPGVSTAREVSDVSGRGVGMDVVRDAIAKLKGSVALFSEVGRGTRVELRLPLTLAITQVLAARVAGEVVAIPLDAVVSAQAAKSDDVEQVAGGFCLRVSARLIPLVELGRVLGFGARNKATSDVNVVIVQVGSEELGLVVQQVLGRYEVVLKPLGGLLAQVPCAIGATLIQDRVLLVVDLAEVSARARQRGSGPAPTPPVLQTSTRGRILVVEDSDVLRESLRRELTEAGFDVAAAADGVAGLELARAQRFDAVTTDVIMPRLDGFGLIRALRDDARYVSVPIVVITGKDARIDALRGRDAGADAYLTKPADSRDLVKTLARLLRQKARARLD